MTSSLEQIRRPYSVTEINNSFEANLTNMENVKEI